MATLVFDTECYKDYWLCSFMDIDTGKVVSLEKYQDQELNRAKLNSILSKHLLISFNGNSYDIPMVSAALNGYTNQQLKDLSDEIIKSNLPAYAVCKKFGLRTISCNHIDLIEVAIGQASLKIYGGRLNFPKIQDLPYHPDDSITMSMRSELKEYCTNDLKVTGLLYKELLPQIELRKEMSEEYGIDLRSKSDAQIATAVIISELTKLTGKEYRKPEVPDEFSFYYNDPQIISFKDPELNALLINCITTPFTLSDKGAVVIPKWLQDKKIKIGNSEYQMGIGGLHSCEKSQFLIADPEHSIIDRDVASYYPSIILQQKLSPKSLGEPFLRLYQKFVTERLKAKKSGDKVKADTFKIVLNSSYGLLGSKYSKLFAPELLIQTTLTGQFALLMLIEAIELAGGRVVSANTDGVVTYCHRFYEAAVEQACWDWMLSTSYELEETQYKLLASRDVNNYLAVKTDGKTKGKGVFTATSLAKNPDCQIIYDSVTKFLAEGKEIHDTVIECDDITKFVTLRRVQGGGSFGELYLGKAVRFYHSTSVPKTEYIRYTTNSNKVPNSDGCRPIMNLPDTFPEDIDYEYYINEAEQLLKDIGYA